MSCIWDAKKPKTQVLEVYVKVVGVKSFYSETLSL